MQYESRTDSSVSTPVEDENTAAEEEYISGEDYREQTAQLTQPHDHSFSWRQKVSVVFLALFGISAVVLWGIQFKSSLGGRQPLPPQQNNAPATGEEARLRSQDTDKDGLSDYEELQFYHTSPYIQDTDSDGASDFEELQNGEDPNCPRGTDCGNAGSASDDNTAAPAQPAGTANPFAASNPDAGSTNNAGGQTADKSAVESILAGEADPARLRELLLEAGMNKDTLDSFSDEQLLQVYTQTLEDYQQ